MTSRPPHQAPNHSCKLCGRWPVTPPVSSRQLPLGSWLPGSASPLTLLNSNIKATSEGLGWLRRPGSALLRTSPLPKGIREDRNAGQPQFPPLGANSLRTRLHRNTEAVPRHPQPGRRPALPSPRAAGRQPGPRSGHALSGFSRIPEALVKAHAAPANPFSP